MGSRSNKDDVRSQRQPDGGGAVPPGGASVDSVNHPAHYTAHPSGVECITVVEHFNFNLGNAVKYIWRAGLKAGLVEDLKKARWYLDREIERIERGAR